MRVLIACESSGVERDAFIAAGHNAMSCDILPTEQPGPHHQGDVRELMGEPFDLVIAHPPCTYLSNSGVRWLHTDPSRWPLLFDAADFFAMMWDFNTDLLCVENPVQHKYAVRLHGKGKPAQTVQPYQFGHLETKRTAYWLEGLPPLVPTNDVKAETFALPVGERSKVHYASPGADRWKLRSKSYQGIADAMAAQWGTNERNQP